MLSAIFEYGRSHWHLSGHLKARTAASYKHAAAAVLGHRAPGEVSDQVVRAVLSAVEKRAPQIAREANPARGLRVTVKKGKRDSWLSDGDLTAAFLAFEELSDRKAAGVYRLILYSLCRPGEAAYVCAEDILVSNGERVWRMYGLEVGGRGPLFWARDIRHTYSQPLRESNAAFRRLSGLDNVRPHDFRRTGRTHLPALGVPESVAEALLNHAKDEIEGTYNLYTYWPERRQALALWHEKLTCLERGGSPAGGVATRD